MIHRAVKSVCSPPYRHIGHIRNQCVPRRTAKAFAHAIGETQHQHRRPCAGKADERTHCSRQTVAGDDERLPSPGAVRPNPGEHLEQCSSRFRDTLDQAEGHRTRAEHRREEDRQQRIDHLARQIGKQADQAEGDHGPWNAATDKPHTLTQR
jgi:hypothetical protein